MMNSQFAGVGVHLVREPWGRGTWAAVWLDGAGRCVELRCFHRTTKGRLFFDSRVVSRYGGDGALLHEIEWRWDRYGRIQREETDLVHAVRRRLAWFGARDKLGQIVGQFVSAPRRPDLALLAVPMGDDEPKPPEAVFSVDLDPLEAIEAERRRQRRLQEAKRRGLDADTLHALESLLTGGPPVPNPAIDLVAFLRKEGDGLLLDGDHDSSLWGVQAGQHAERRA